MDWIALTLGAVGGLITATVTAVLAWRRLRPDIEKTQAETAKLVGQAWIDLLTTMSKEVEGLRLRVSVLEKEIDKRDNQWEMDRKRIKELENEIAVLKHQLKELGQTPRSME